MIYLDALRCQVQAPTTLVLLLAKKLYPWIFANCKPSMSSKRLLVIFLDPRCAVCKPM